MLYLVRSKNKFLAKRAIINTQLPHKEKLFLDASLAAEISGWDCSKIIPRKIYFMTQNPIDILLVEDNPDDLDLALYALRRNQLAKHIHVVRDGIEALDFIFCRGDYQERNCTQNPKLVLLDLNMPKLNGFEVLEAIRTNPSTSGIPVVILTTSKEESDLIESYRLGVNSYIVKPVDFEQFSDVVRQLGFYWLLLNERPSMRAVA
jgi:CheY-like chemotaxis protein